MKEITMPKLSDTMTEGTLVAWRKGVGATVERGEVIAEVETDKATMELEAFASGVLAELRVTAGTTVAVGTVIGVIAAPGEQPAASPAAGGPKTVPRPAAPVELAQEAQQMPASTPLDRAAEDEPPAAPVIRRRARELGIDLAAVKGSGPGGRILMSDLDAITSSQTADKPTPSAPPEPPDASAPPAAESAHGEPLSRMRAAVARTVTESWRTIPHFSISVDVRMDAAELRLRQLRDEGVKVSPTALLVKASAQTLTEFPHLNASLYEGKLLVHPEINIGIVVRRDDGLVVPVLRDCAHKSLDEVAERTSRLVDRARSGRLSDTELSGGTFAISNLGMYGIDSFVALILPPMAAVLATGAVHDAVVADAGQPVVARLLTLTLSADHRLVDGAYAARFLQRLKALLEHPDSLAS